MNYVVHFQQENTFYQRRIIFLVRRSALSNPWGSDSWLAFYLCYGRETKPNLYPGLPSEPCTQTPARCSGSWWGLTRRRSQASLLEGACMKKAAEKTMPCSITSAKEHMWKWCRSARACTATWREQGNTETLLLHSLKHFLTLGQPLCCITLL